MKTVVNLRKCMIGILMLSVTGGEMVQARRYTTYRKPVYTTGRYRVTVINHMSSPVRIVQHISVRERWGMITAYLGKHPHITIRCKKERDRIHE